MWRIYWKFYHIVNQDFIYDNLLLDCYKIARFAKGGASVDYLKNLPMDSLMKEIAIVNKAAEQEKQLIEIEQAKASKRKRF